MRMLRFGVKVHLGCHSSITAGTLSFMMGWPFLLFLSSLMTAASGQISLNVSRSTFPATWNILTLTCENIDDSSPPLFFRGTERVDVPDPTSFLIDQSQEGNYTCGIGRSISPQSVTIVALPDPEVVPSNKSIYSEEDSTARLDCSITPGVASSQYYVTWRDAIDEDMVYYESYPPRESSEPYNFDDTRYSIDPRNFSLFIRDVSHADENDYLCILAVEDPVSLMDYQFAITANVLLSLSVFKAPIFIDELRDQIVTNGTEVIFRCSVLSSPKASQITWLHKNSLTRRGDDHYHIRTIAYTEGDSEMITNSTLTIFNVSGYDSGVVECLVEYFANGVAIVTATDQSQAVLGVLDTVNSLRPVALQSGGYIFTISLKESLLVPISLRFVYTQAGTGQMNTVRSTTFFFNSSLINYVAFREEMQFDEFQVGVALEHGVASGPLFSNPDVYRQVNISTRVIVLYGIIFFLGLLLLIILLLLLILLCLWCKTTQVLQSQLKYDPLKDLYWKSEIDYFDRAASMIPNHSNRKLVEDIIKQLMALEFESNETDRNRKATVREDKRTDQKYTHNANNVISKAVNTNIKTNVVGTDFVGGHHRIGRARSSSLSSKGSTTEKHGCKDSQRTNGSVGEGHRIGGTRSFSLSSKGSTIEKQRNRSIEDRRNTGRRNTDTVMEVKTRDSKIDTPMYAPGLSTKHIANIQGMCFDQSKIQLMTENGGIDTGIKTSTSVGSQGIGGICSPSQSSKGSTTVSRSSHGSQTTSSSVGEGQRIRSTQSIENQSSHGSINDGNITENRITDTGMEVKTRDSEHDASIDAPGVSTESNQHSSNTANNALIQAQKIGFNERDIQKISDNIKNITQSSKGSTLKYSQNNDGSIRNQGTNLTVIDTAVEEDDQDVDFDKEHCALYYSLRNDQRTSSKMNHQRTYNTRQESQTMSGASSMSVASDIATRTTTVEAQKSRPTETESQRSGRTVMDHLNVVRTKNMSERMQSVYGRASGIAEQQNYSHYGSKDTTHAGRNMSDLLRVFSDATTPEVKNLSFSEVDRRALLENSSALIAAMRNSQAGSQQAGGGTAASAFAETTGMMEYNAQRTSRAIGTILSRRSLSGPAVGKRKNLRVYGASKAIMDSRNQSRSCSMIVEKSPVAIVIDKGD